jgi:hypothetical protein
METMTLHIRARSSGAARRGGLELLPLSTWVEADLSLDLDGARCLLRLAEDGKVDVEIGEPKGEGEFNWHPAPSVEDIRAHIANLEAKAKAEAVERASEPARQLNAQLLDVNGPTKLPTTEPTLERELSTHTPPEKAAAEPQKPQVVEGAAAVTPPSPPPPGGAAIPASTPGSETPSSTATASKTTKTPSKREPKPKPEAEKPKA